MLEDHKVLPVKSKLEELRGHTVIKVNIKTGGVIRSQSRTSKIKTWGVTKAQSRSGKIITGGVTMNVT